METPYFYSAAGDYFGLRDDQFISLNGVVNTFSPSFP